MLLTLLATCVSFGNETFVIIKASHCFTTMHLKGVLSKHKDCTQTQDGSACLRRISIRNGPIIGHVL